MEYAFLVLTLCYIKLILFSIIHTINSNEGTWNFEIWSYSYFDRFCRISNNIYGVASNFSPVCHTLKAKRTAEQKKIKFTLTCIYLGSKKRKSRDICHKMRKYKSQRPNFNSISSYIPRAQQQFFVSFITEKMEDFFGTF